MLKQKNFRVSEEILNKFLELRKIYNSKSDNQLFELIINDIYELKKSKALIPFEELKEKDIQLQKALLEIGKLQGILQEKEKQLQKVEQEKENEKKKGFWARLFSR